MNATPLCIRLLFSPGNSLRELAAKEATARSWLPLTLALMTLPPLCAAAGGYLFGWRLGTPQPLLLSHQQLWVVSLLYWLLLCAGFFGTVLLARWMGTTYGAQGGVVRYLDFFTVVCAPLSLASLAHLYPNLFLNVLALLLAAIWSMTLLYRGLPVVLKISGERGMLMASAIVGWLLVAMVSLLGLSAGLWTAGFGPSISV